MSTMGRSKVQRQDDNGTRTRRSKGPQVRVRVREIIEGVIDGNNDYIQADDMSEICEIILEHGGFDADVDRQDVHRALQALHAEGVIRVSHSGASIYQDGARKRHRVFRLR